MSIKILFGLLLSAILLSSCKKTTEELFDEAYNLTKKEEYDKAIKIYSDLLKRNSKLQLVYYNRGYCYYSKKDYRRALFDFNKIIELQTPGNGKFIFTLNSEGPFASEEAKYQVSYYDALYQRAQVHFYIGDNKESFQDFTNLVASDYIEKANCYLWLGSITLNNGDTANACKYFLNSKKFANNKDVLQEAEKMLVTYCPNDNNR